MQWESLSCKTWYEKEINPFKLRERMLELEVSDHLVEDLDNFLGLGEGLSED